MNRPSVEPPHAGRQVCAATPPPPSSGGQLGGGDPTTRTNGDEAIPLYRLECNPITIRQQACGSACFRRVGSSGRPARGVELQVNFTHGPRGCAEVTPMSRLVEFYRGEASDTEGRRLEEIWAWDDDSLEAVHD